MFQIWIFLHNKQMWELFLEWKDGRFFHPVSLKLPLKSSNICWTKISYMLEIAEVCVWFLGDRWWNLKYFQHLTNQNKVTLNSFGNTEKCSCLFRLLLKYSSNMKQKKSRLLRRQQAAITHFNSKRAISLNRTKRDPRDQSWSIKTCVKSSEEWFATRCSSWGH